jgi:hypothetical protein
MFWINNPNSSISCWIAFRIWSRDYNAYSLTYIDEPWWRSAGSCAWRHGVCHTYIPSSPHMLTYYPRDVCVSRDLLSLFRCRGRKQDLLRSLGRYVVESRRLPANGRSLLEILFRPGTSKLRSVNLPWLAGKVKAARHRMSLTLEWLRCAYFIFYYFIFISIIICVFLE